jgi:hypothetical protein
VGDLVDGEGVMASHDTFGDTTLPPALDALVQSELSGGERLLWVGQPQPRRYLLYSIPIMLFGVLWTAFAVFWVVMASVGAFGAAAQGGAPGGVGAVFACFPLCGLPFVLIGLGMLTSPYWMLRAARRTCYALTDRRAIVWEPRWGSGYSVRSYGPAELTRICRNQNADGSGDLIFEQSVSYDSRGRRNVKSQGFFAIERVRDIEELIRRVLLSGGVNNP